MGNYLYKKEDVENYETPTLPNYKELATSDKSYLEIWVQIRKYTNSSSLKQKKVISGLPSEMRRLHTSIKEGELIQTLLNPLSYEFTDNRDVIVKVLKCTLYEV